VSRPRVLVFNQYYSPAFESTAQLLTQLCESLAAEYDIAVVTGVVEGAGPSRDTVNGVEVHRVWSTSFPRRRLSLRGINYLSYVGSSLWAGVTEQKPDLILCMSDPPFMPGFARVVAQRFRVPYVAIVQDVFPEIAVELGRLSNPVIVRTLDSVVSMGLRGAARVVAIGETMRQRLVEKGVEPARIVVIRNWVDADQLVPADKDNAWSREHDLADKFVVMHSGNVGYAQNLDLLVRASTFLRDLDNVRFVIIGNGAKKLELMALAERLDADNIIFMPYQDKEVLPLSLSTGDIHFVGLARRLSGYIVPSRMNGVLSVARPVLVAAERDSEIVSVVETSDAGVTIPAGRAELLAGAIRDAYEGKYDLAEMGRRGRKYVEQEIDRPVAIQRYRELVHELLS
jgi:glycosyltransferase involved in cell wall biosynthesis